MNLFVPLLGFPLVWTNDEFHVSCLKTHPSCLCCTSGKFTYGHTPLKFRGTVHGQWGTTALFWKEDGLLSSVDIQIIYRSTTHQLESILLVLDFVSYEHEYKATFVCKAGSNEFVEPRILHVRHMFWTKTRSGTRAVTFCGDTCAVSESQAMMGGMVRAWH